MSAICIETIDITKQFGETKALANVNLSIEEGEFFSFLGPSGCGKTTLLRIIAGFETPSAGRLLIDGQDMLNRPAHKRPVNMVFQNYALFPHLSIAENVAFGLKARGNKDRNDIAGKVKEALHLVRLDNFAERFPNQLSGGQQQRVALARAVINRPRVLLLDEPLSALDPQIREEMQEELKSLQRKLNLTFIMVTHDQNEALAMSHRLAVFSAGKVQQVAVPEEVYERPASVFVAKFIGQTNLLKASVKALTDEFIELWIGKDKHLCALKTLALKSQDVHKLPELQIGEPVIFYFKPQAVSLALSDDVAAASEEKTVNEIEGVVESASYQGHSTEYVVCTENTDKFRVVIANENAQQRLKEGSRVVARVSVSACSIFRDADQSEYLNTDTSVNSVAASLSRPGYVAQNVMEPKS